MAGTRASDADRDLCLNDIESAFADGRIDDTERESRTQSALQAKTLDELAQLTADLRPPNAAPRITSALSTASMPKGLLTKILIGDLVPAIASVIIWIASSSGNSSSSETDNTSPVSYTHLTTPTNYTV